MRAFVIKEYAHPLKISLSDDAPEPKPAEDEVLVEVFTAGLNYFDVSFPFIHSLLPPHDYVRPRSVDPTVSGEVSGSTTAPFHSGLRVCGADRGGLTDSNRVLVQARR